MRGTYKTDAIAKCFVGLSHEHTYTCR